MLIAEASAPPAVRLRPYFFFKRLVDVVVSAGVLALFGPVMLTIAAAIRLESPGPALFRQRRYGYGSQQFEVLKFRTMFADQTDRSGVRQTQRHDDRVTRVGRFLRRANLDELPQLINVLKGDMSLVGPRPHVPGMLAGGVLYEELAPFYFERHRVRPGITGLAQACGLRGSTQDPRPAIERIHHDLTYVRNCCMSLDLRILWCTLRNECMKGTGI
jgi:polysaccharide biosynthesis protein PslA